MITRICLSELESWQKSKDRKPLILKGARQVGKTFILKQFAASSFNNFYYFNFEKELSIHKIFEGDLNPRFIKNNLEIQIGKKINEETDLIIFDEIQSCPRALTSLKYFAEDMPNQHVAAAGSLLGVFLNSEPFPVGKVTWLNIGPFNFREFLQALEQENLLIEMLKKPSEFLHIKLWQLWKEYLVVGGLPEVVMSYKKHRSESPLDCFQIVRSVQESLVNSYIADMTKHSGEVNAMHLERLWRNIPTQLAREQSGKFTFKDVIPKKNRYADLANAIDWLEKAELIYRVPIINNIDLPLSANAQENTFKLFIFDCGILNFLANLEYKNIFSYDFGYYKGFIAENFALQELKRVFRTPLFNWMSGQSEIDFMLQVHGDILPIEVKSGNNPRSKSLLHFMRTHNEVTKALRMSGRGLINKKGQSVGTNRGKIFDFPLYLLAESINMMP
jgi:predicted AAA+ superfamily ATPase